MSDGSSEILEIITNRELANSQDKKLLDAVRQDSPTGLQDDRIKELLDDASSYEEDAPTSIEDFFSEAIDDGTGPLETPLQV